MTPAARHPRRPPAPTAVVVVVLTGLLALAPASSPVRAAELAAGLAANPAAVLDTLAAVPGGNLLEEVAPVEPSTSIDRVLTVDTPVTDTVVSEDPTTPIHLTSQLGKEVTLALPYPETSETAVPVDSGVVAFANSQGFTTVPIVKEDGSTQVVLVVESANAPERYPFQVDLPEGAWAGANEDGGVVFYSADLEFLGGLAPPWAKDANGAELATHYEVDDANSGTIIQVIEHQAGAAYPVVASSWVGIDFFGQAEYDRPGTDGHGDVVLSVALSPWGRYVYTAASSSLPYWAGRSILLIYGWPELVGKLPRASDKPTIYDQYGCHVFFGYAYFGLGTQWDLEMARVSKPDWPVDRWEHRCNWEEYD